jgi:ribose transport system ATP-binding protein
VGKEFSGVRVLEGVDLEIRSGEAHVVAGENGAGKSTLMNVLSGVHREYDGRIVLRGEEVRFRSSADAAGQGIAMIHQEMSLVPSMSVMDNIFLGRETAVGGAWLNRSAQRRIAAPLLERLGLQIDLSRPIGSYPVSVRQVVEIAKAMAFDVRILIMDEPTSALNRPEIERLFHVIRELKQAGCGIVFISHKMDEIYAVGDRITVLRDGRKVGTARRKDLSREQLVKWMVGRDLTHQFPPRPRAVGKKTRFVVKNFSLDDPEGYRGRLVDRISFRVREGEVLGIAGLEGSGNHELLHGLFGFYGKAAQGSVSIDGNAFIPRSPAHSISAGMSLLTNDRKGKGLVFDMSVLQNLTLASIRRLSSNGWLRPRREKTVAANLQESLGIRMTSAAQSVAELSGGNQQKVVFGKWLATDPQLLLLDEPTRGVDVGAKHEIYGLMNRLSEQGIAIVLITSELPELLAMSDRIMVMHRGGKTAEFADGSAGQETIMLAAMGRPLETGKTA